jgi:hypothetical protein
MTDVVDPRRLAAEIYAAVQNARRDDVGVAALCAVLDRLAESRGQNKFRHAASVLRGTELRRSTIDDREALRRIAAFPPARRSGAVGIVALQVAGPGATKKRVAAIARRLRRKGIRKKDGGLRCAVKGSFVSSDLPTAPTVVSPARTQPNKPASSKIKNGQRGIVR